VGAHFSPDNSRGLPGSTSQGIACILQWLGAKKKDMKMGDFTTAHVKE
jgi:hypothetical protein